MLERNRYSRAAEGFLCKVCSCPTPALNIGTGMCDSCWEVNRTVTGSPRTALRLLMQSSDQKELFLAAYEMLSQENKKAIVDKILIDKL